MKRGDSDGLTERDSQRDLMRRKRAKSRDLQIPAIADPIRRKLCEEDVYEFLRTYLSKKFPRPFTPDQREMVSEILRCARYGEDQAIAAARGDGKSSIAEGVLIYCLVTGKLKFPLIGGANGPMAVQSLANIKFEFEDNDLLAADFPEICTPIRALEGANQRAGTQTVNGKRTRLQWAGEMVVFPTVEGSAASGSVLMAKGLDAAVRGVRYRNQRPDFALLDDAETRESAESQSQTEKRERIIEEDIGGLAGPGRRLGRVLLCTITNRRCVAFRYTDRAQKPSWHGRRYRLLATKPDREDLWETYVLKRQTEGRESALAFYVERREAMDAGAVVSNPNRIEPGQLSGVQHCYDIVADKGWSAFANEYQNDPPEEDEPETSGITAALIQTKVNGYPRGTVPQAATVLTAGFDVGERACHWVVIAWEPGARGYVVDYGVAEVHRVAGENDAGINAAIQRAIHTWREETLANPYLDEGGQPRPLAIQLVDSGDRTDAVYGFIKEVGGKPFRASKGFGSGLKQSPFRGPMKPEPGVVLGEHWYAKLQPSGIWLHGLESDYWKRWMFDRLGTPINGRGSLTIFGTLDEARQHHSFARHLVAEEYDADAKRFIRVNRNNHWGDAVYMACAAAGMARISLVPLIVAERSIATNRSQRVDAGQIGKYTVKSYRGRF